MPEKNAQLVTLTEDDRKLLKELVKWIKFFPLMYLVLWIVMCIGLIASMWLIWGTR